MPTKFLFDRHDKVVCVCACKQVCMEVTFYISTILYAFNES